MRCAAVGLALLCCASGCGRPLLRAERPGDPPTVPVGLDAFRQWDRWPVLRIGQRTYMRSTYDRTGGNLAADAGSFLRQDAPDRFVPLDVAGPGVLTFVRTNYWHGSPWHYTVDGADHVVQESSTADPSHPVSGSIFLPPDAFPRPLTWTWAQTHGADLSWVPVSFERSFSLAYERTHTGTGYFIYQQFPQGADNLSRPLAAWNEEPPDPDVLTLLASAGQDIAPAGDGVRVDQGQLDVPAEGAVTVAELTAHPAVVRALTFRVPRGSEQAFGRVRLRITWDGRPAPSVDAPVALFFGTGSLYNRQGREYLVKAMPVSVRFAPDAVTFAMYFPMPYFERARVELEGAGEAVQAVSWRIRTQAETEPRNAVGYFHATYRDHGEPVPGQDLVLLDTTEQEGGGDWCGSFVGTSFIFSDRADLTTLEGDPRFFFDDSQTPQAQGTGTEEWGGGGNYWDSGATTTLPFAGHPVGAPNPAAAANDEDRIESAYRFLLSDLFPFGRNARIQLEHGATNDSTEHYRSVAYWYGFPGACLTQTDTFHVGDPDDEALHRYLSPDASPVETLSSRYEWGVDHLDGAEIFPESTDSGRHTTGASEFTLQLVPKNLGLLLRRKLDYAFPDQRADVFVADDRPDAPFVPVGTWYLAGSNQAVFSLAATETSAPNPSLYTSNRRWRDDEFLIPRSVTEGRSAVRVRLVFSPTGRPIAPGLPVPAQAWSEFRYIAYCWVMPESP